LQDKTIPSRSEVAANLSGRSQMLDAFELELASRGLCVIEDWIQLQRTRLETEKAHLKERIEE